MAVSVTVFALATFPLIVTVNLAERWPLGTTTAAGTGAVTRSVLEGLALSDTDRYAEQGVLNIIDANDFIEMLAAKRLPPGRARPLRGRHRCAEAGFARKQADTAYFRPGKA